MKSICILYTPHCSSPSPQIPMDVVKDYTPGKPIPHILIHFKRGVDDRIQGIQVKLTGVVEPTSLLLISPHTTFECPHVTTTLG